MVHFLTFFEYLNLASILVPALVLIRSRKTGLSKSIAGVLVTFVICKFNYNFIVYIFNTGYPAFHINSIFSLLSLMAIFYQFNIKRMWILFLTVLGISLFLYESVYQQGWFENNERMTVYCNVCIIIVSVYYFVYYLKNPELPYYPFVIPFTAVLFFADASSIIISLYESELRTEISWKLVFAVSFLNFLEALFHFILAYAVWKLDKARKRDILTVD
jgi:hypothetical protein